MDTTIITQPPTTVKALEVIQVPAFNLSLFTEMCRNDVEDPDFTQSTTFPALRGAYRHQGPAPQGLPHQSMNLAERVTLMRGPEEEGID